MSHHPVADELIARNGRYASDDHLGGLRAEPSRQVTVVTCMDARIDVEMMLGLERGEAHVLRNAGGVLTDDVVRSVALSQRLLGTREVILIHHTACGLHGLDEAAFLDELTRAAGAAPTWKVGSFADPAADVARSLRELSHNKFLAHRDHLRGFVFDIETGKLDEVEAGDG